MLQVGGIIGLRQTKKLSIKKKKIQRESNGVSNIIIFPGLVLLGAGAAAASSGGILIPIIAATGFTRQAIATQKSLRRILQLIGQTVKVSSFVALT